MRLRNVKNKEEILSNCSFVIDNPTKYKGKWNILFNNNNEINIEIGTGKCKFIYEMALKNPNINYIGIEKSASILAIATKRLERLNNLYLINYDALKLDEVFSNEISKIYLNFSKTEYDEDMKKSLFESVIISHEISNLKYKQILMSLKYDYDNFDIVGISGDKIIILIDVDIIRMTVDNLKFMRENYINQKFYYIHKNIDEYIDIMQEALFSKEELLEILTWYISDELKIQLLRFTDDEISIIGKSYSSAICLYILENNFEDTDLTELCSSFDQWDESIQAKIF